MENVPQSMDLPQSAPLLRSEVQSANSPDPVLLTYLYARERMTALNERTTPLPSACLRTVARFPRSALSNNILCRIENSSNV